MAIFSRKVRFLIKKSNLSDAQKKLLETPPEIVKMKIDYLVSFSDKPRENPPRAQNPWIIFLKNFGEYLRETFPDESFPIVVISRRASAVWRALEDTDIIKIYFGILAKMAEENRKITFLENNNNSRIIKTSSSGKNSLSLPPPPSTFVSGIYRNEFIRNFFNGSSPNTNTMSSHQEDDCEEPSNGNEIIHQYYSGNQSTLYSFSNGL
nr:4034_t:CDS:2 [Entrophospora candida]